MKDHDDRVTKLMADIAARLRPVCGHFSEADFASLVADVARTKLRFEQIDSMPHGVPALRDPS